MKIGFLHPENEFTEAMLRMLRKQLPEHEVVSWVAKREAPAGDFEVLISLGSVTGAMLAGQPKLGFVQTASTGYESVDVEAATEAGIWVSFAPSDVTGNAASVAEFAVMLLLGAARRLGAYLKAYAGPEGAGSEGLPLILPALHGKTVCIVGLGAVGGEIAQRLRPFGVRLLATDEHPGRAPEGVRGYPAEQLAEVLPEADFVLLCVRASRENENLFDAAMLGRMKRGAVLVNVARGSLIDEGALAAALESGQIAAAGLDVVREEPLQTGNPLLRFSQVLATPHLAGFTDVMLRGTTEFLVEVVREAAAGRKPRSVLNAPGKPRMALKESAPGAAL